MAQPSNEYPFTMRMTQEERRLFKRVADHHGLKMAQVIRLLVKQADHRRSGEMDRAARADAAWTTAIAAFWQTGVAERLGKAVAFENHVRATTKSLDELIALAKELGELGVHDAVARFRGAVASYPKLHARERSEVGASLLALFRAQGDAAHQMFSWAVRRTNA
jgi:hypothetical protein